MKSNHSLELWTNTGSEFFLIVKDTTPRIPKRSTKQQASVQTSPAPKSDVVFSGTSVEPLSPSCDWADPICPIGKNTKVIETMSRVVSILRM